MTDAKLVKISSKGRVSYIKMIFLYHFSSFLPWAIFVEQIWYKSLLFADLFNLNGVIIPHKTTFAVLYQNFSIFLFKRFFK